MPRVIEEMFTITCLILTEDELYPTGIAVHHIAALLLASFKIQGLSAEYGIDGFGRSRRTLSYISAARYS